MAGTLCKKSWLALGKTVALPPGAIFLRINGFFQLYMLKLWPNSSSNLRYSPLHEVKSTLIVSCFKYQNKESTYGRELTADDKFVLNISCSTDRLFANAMSHSTFDIVIPTYWTWQWFGGPVINRDVDKSGFIRRLLIIAWFCYLCFLSTFSKNYG